MPNLTSSQLEDFAPVSVSRIWIRNAGHRTGANQRVESTLRNSAKQRGQATWGSTSGKTKRQAFSRDVGVNPDLQDESRKRGA